VDSPLANNIVQNTGSGTPEACPDSEWQARVRLALAELARRRTNLPGECWLLAAGSPSGTAATLVKAAAALADKIVAIDSGAALLTAAKIQPDLLVGDMDSIDANLLLQLRDSDVWVEATSAYKDQTDLELALELAANRDVRSLVLVGALGGRLDHELAVLGATAAYSKQMDILIIGDDAIVWPLAAGRASSLEVGRLLDCGQTFSAIALTGNTQLSESGCEWNLNQAALPPLNPRGVSNIVRNPNAQATITTGSAAIIIPRVI
jgi:thiamine pyrophosphokinase